MGTPNTGSSVSDAVMPGRWAAPPAPAMMILKPAALRALGKGEQPVRGAMGRDDVLFAGDAERGQGFGGMAHGVPVRLASHDNGYGRGHAVNSFRESKNIGRIIGLAQGSARRGKGSGMDYPVLVNPGKPPRNNGHEEENQVDRFGYRETPQKRRRGAEGGPAAHQAAEGSARRRGRSPPMMTNRPFAGSGPNWRWRGSGSTNYRRTPTLTSCWIFSTGAVSSGSSIARSPISSVITPAAR